MQRPTPPPVPPVVGTNHAPVVIDTTRRPAKRRGRGGASAAAVSMLLAMTAVVAAFVAWPYLQPSLRPGKRTARKKQVAAVVDRGEPPRVSQPGREEKQQQEPQPVKDPLMSAPPDLAARDRAPDDGVMAATAAKTITPLPEADQADAGVTEDLVRMITDAAKAFRRHDFAAAEMALETAAESAGDEAEPATRVERWRLLLDYAKQLDDHVTKALASANQGREYTIGDRTIAIIEIGPQGYAYKEAGATRRGPRASLPRVVERAILKAWYDGDPRPSNGIFLGVHRLLDDDVDLDRVRQEWQQALAGEPATASIMPILDDPVLAPGP
jgi:hypothetical protein